MEAILGQMPGFNLLDDLTKLIGRVFRLQQGASGGTTKTGKKVMLPRKAVQALGGGNWAKGRGMLNKGTATASQVSAAKKSAAKSEGKPAGKIAARSANTTKKTSKTTPKTPAQRGVETRNANEARRTAAGRPSRPTREKRELERTRREIMRGATGSFNNERVKMRSGRDRNGNII